MKHEFTMLDALLALTLAANIHRTNAAVIHTAYLLRDKVQLKYRPVIGKFIRSKSPWELVYLVSPE